MKNTQRLRIGLIWCFGIITLILATHGSARAQAPTPTPPSLKKDITISVAVMDPKNVADIFGRRVANRYIAVQLTVGNKSPDFQFLIQDVLMDVQDVYIDRTLLHVDRKGHPYYVPTSEDKLLVRGVAEKGQLYDPSNFIFRALKAVGSIAATVTGIASVGPAYAPTVAMFNGPALTSYRDVFPDMTINQMNRLNDNGYTTNTLVGKQSSKLLVAFIPQALLMESKYRDKFRKDPLSIANQIDFRNLGASVHGVFMTLVEEAPPAITSIEIPQSEMRKFAADKPEVKGQILGKRLEGAELSVDGPANLNVSVNGEPEENRIRFTLKADGPIPPGTSLKLTVARNGREDSRSQDVAEGAQAPTLTSVSKSEISRGALENLVLTGSDFLLDAESTRILITPDDSSDGTPAIEVVSKKIKNQTSIELGLKSSEKAPAREYEIRVVTPAGISNPQRLRLSSSVAAANQ